jgi:hypothetical protein
MPTVLFIGDITGPAALALVTQQVPRLRQELQLDLVIANADNVAVTGPRPMGGSGMTVAAIEALFASGIDVITSGTHAWDGPEAAQALEHPRVLRALNLQATSAGRGVLTVTAADEPIAVVNLAATTLAGPIRSPYQAWQEVQRPGTAIVHFVGTAHDARVFAHAVDGQVAAVLGTLAHEASRYSYLLPGGTALVPDVGMVGPFGGIGGFAPHSFVAGLKGEESDAAAAEMFVDTPLIFDAVVLQIEGGTTQHVGRIDVGRVAQTDGGGSHGR